MRSLHRLLITLLLLLALPLQGWAAAHGCVALQQHRVPAGATGGHHHAVAAADHVALHAVHPGADVRYGPSLDAGAVPLAADPVLEPGTADAAGDGAPTACTQCASCCVAAVLAADGGSPGAPQAPATAWAAWSPTVVVGFVTDGPERPPRNLLA